MKKLLLLTIALLMTASVFAQEQESNIRIPSGYQGFLEYGNTFVFDKDADNTINLSTTHGFFMNSHTYIGIGLSIDMNKYHTVVPIYANVRYIFNHKPISPVMGIRLGSFISDNVKCYGDIMFGVRFATKRDFAINLMLSGTYYDNMYREHYTEYYDENGILQYGYQDIKYNLSGISLKMGIEW